MNNLKNDEYYVRKILTDLYFIQEHMQGVAKKRLEKTKY